MKDKRPRKEAPRVLRPLELERHQHAVDTRAARAAQLAGVPDAPVFRPTAEEFRDPIAYIRKIQPLVAPEYGICRIVPPVGAAVPAAAVLAACAAGGVARAQAAWAGAMAGGGGDDAAAGVAAERAALAAARRPGPVRFTVRTQDLVAAAAPWRSFLEARTFAQHPGTFTLQSFEALAAEAAGRALGTSAPLPPLQVEAEYWRVHEEGRRARAVAVPPSAVAAATQAQAQAAQEQEARPPSSKKRRADGGGAKAPPPPPPAKKRASSTPPRPAPAGPSDRRAGSGASGSGSGNNTTDNDNNDNDHRPHSASQPPPPSSLVGPGGLRGREAAVLIRDARNREALMVSGPRPRQRPVEYWRMGSAEAAAAEAAKGEGAEGGEEEGGGGRAAAAAAADVSPQQDGGARDKGAGATPAKRKRAGDQQQQGQQVQQQQQQEEAPLALPPAPSPLPLLLPPPPSSSSAPATSRRPGPLPQPVLVHYGNDVEGTAFSDAPGDPLARSAWNLNALARASGSPLALLGPSVVPGVNRPMLYVGMALASFAWHVEDQWLYSINYHHFGAPKTWYGAPAVDAELLERAVAGLVGAEEAAAAVGARARAAARGGGVVGLVAAEASTPAAIHDPTAPYAPAAAALMSRARAAATAAALPRGASDALASRAAGDAAAAALATKTTLACPVRLRAAGVRVCRAVHRAGEFVVTFPRAYHGGFSHGLNVGEAVNFCTGDWHAWAEGAAELAGRRLGRAAILPHERMLAREARRIMREVEAYERAVEELRGQQGGEEQELPPHPLDPRPLVVPRPAPPAAAAAAAAGEKAGGAVFPPSPAAPLLVPRSAAWSAARCFLRMMRRLRAAREEARARGVEEVVGGGEDEGKGEGEEGGEEAPAQPSPACARCGSACYGLMAAEHSDRTGLLQDEYREQQQRQQEQEQQEQQEEQPPLPPLAPPPPSPLCARCLMVEPRCRGASWALVVDAEIPALDALARRWERGELGGRWLRRPGEAVAGGVVVGGVGGVAAAAGGGSASKGRARGRRDRSASPAGDAGGDAGLFLHETGLGPGLPADGVAAGAGVGASASAAAAAAAAAAAPSSSSLPGDVPAAWLALLRAPSGVAAAPIARRMAMGTPG